ncbi:ribonuclease P [Malassezia yamatoensis]|uniref:Ribonuclease P n=1 Tax=Malassezia yamatoensis TaxID=253288 RepID=A0AAJ5YWU5_9BASI|nr:ribonuclease P [Malassezia yamatoensis]
MDNRELFESILVPSAKRKEEYESRVHGKRVQISNAARAAPAPASAMLARQARRAQARMRRAEGIPGPTPSTSSGPCRPRKMPYSQAIMMNTLWLTYARELVGIPDSDSQLESIEQLEQNLKNPAQSQNIQNTLLKADWTGAELYVVRSTNASLVHLCGIVVQETHETLRIVQNNQEKVRTIPKHNTVFRVQIPTSDSENASLLTFELYGNQMRYTLPARATRKHKARKTIELS